MTHPYFAVIERIANGRTESLLWAIDRKDFHQNDIALIYGALIGSDVDWPSVNTAIMTRWSKSGLRHVKRLAWKWKEQANRKEVERS